MAEDFIQDELLDMTCRDRNMQLSAELAAGVNATRCIARIEREAEGWRIYFQVG